MRKAVGRLHPSICNPKSVGTYPCPNCSKVRANEMDTKSLALRTPKLFLGVYNPFIKEGA